MVSDKRIELVCVDFSQITTFVNNFLVIFDGMFPLLLLLNVLILALKP